MKKKLYRFISVFQVESMQRGLGREESKDGVENIVKELEDVEKKMLQLEKDREDKCKKIMDRRVQQVNTLQELGNNFPLLVYSYYRICEKELITQLKLQFYDSCIKCLTVETFNMLN